MKKELEKSNKLRFRESDSLFILKNVKIFQFLHNLSCISGQYVLCRKENLIVLEYNKFGDMLNE